MAPILEFLGLPKPDRGSALTQGEDRGDGDNAIVADGYASFGARGDRKLLRCDTGGPGAGLPGEVTSKVGS